MRFMNRSWIQTTATIGMILRQIQENAGILGRIVIGLVGIAWSVLTYFVVPVLLYEPVARARTATRLDRVWRRPGEAFRIRQVVHGHVARRADGGQQHRREVLAEGRDLDDPVVAPGLVVPRVTHGMDDSRHPVLDDGYTPDL